MTTTQTTKHETITEGMMDPETIGTGDNHRTQFDETKMAELTQNVRQYGVLNAILCRPFGDDEAHHRDHKYMLVAGARRLRAAINAKMPKIPVRVVQATPEQAMALQAFENLHREDLAVLDEARAFAKMLAQGQATKADLAESVNKSESYVTKAVSLLDLPEKTLEALAAGKITASHCHHILRVPAERREEFTDFCLREPYYSAGLPTVAKLIEHIDQELGRQLEAAVFPLDREYAGAAACAACPSNTANQTMLFAEAEAGQCMNPACYAAKVKQFDEDVAQEAAGKYKGMKCLGTKEPKYNCHGHLRAVGKGIVVEAELAKSPEIKKAMKAKPGAFGYAVDASTHKTILVLTDPEMVAEVKQAREAEHGGGNSAEKKEQHFHTQYLQAAVNKALLTAAAGQKIKMGVPEVVKIIGNMENCHDEVHALLGMPHKRDEKTLSKQPLDKLIMLLWLNSICDWSGNPDVKLLIKCGLNVKSISKAAINEAKAQYEIDKAEAAQAKKAKKQGGEE